MLWCFYVSCFWIDNFLPSLFPKLKKSLIKCFHYRNTTHNRNKWLQHHKVSQFYFIPSCYHFNSHLCIHKKVQLTFPLSAIWPNGKQSNFTDVASNSALMSPYSSMLCPNLLQLSASICLLTNTSSHIHVWKITAPVGVLFSGSESIQTRNWQKKTCSTNTFVQVPKQEKFPSACSSATNVTKQIDTWIPEDTIKTQHNLEAKNQ